MTAVSVIGSDSLDFTHNFSGPVTIPGGDSALVEVTFSPQVAAGPDMLAPGDILYRVNAGGAVSGDWEEDTDAMPSSYLLAGSANIETDAASVTLDGSVPAGTPTDIFTTKRIDANQAAPLMEWDFPVTPGVELEVRMYFVEMSRCSIGNRIFDVQIEGATVIDDIDVFTEAGSACNVGIMRSAIVTPLDDTLDVDFPLVNGKPSTIAGFEIVESGGATTSMRTAQLLVDHTGLNPSLTSDLSGKRLVRVLLHW